MRSLTKGLCAALLGAALLAVLIPGCDSGPTRPSLTDGAAASLAAGDTSVTSLPANGLAEMFTFTIERAKTKCGKEGEPVEEGEVETPGKDYIKIGGRMQGFDPTLPLELRIRGVPNIFGPVSVTIPPGAKGPVVLPGFLDGTIKASLPKKGTGNFQINVDARGLNRCDDPPLIMSAELFLTLNGVTESITVRRSSESKFHW
jgi:hypothetical protein